MKTFNIYKHPDPSKKIEVVKIGFSWIGFLFPIIWLPIKKLWLQFAVIFGTFILIEIVSSSSTEPVINGILMLIQLGLFLLVGFRGNSWLENDLSNRGYELIRQVRAKSKEHALALYIQNPEKV